MLLGCEQSTWIHNTRGVAWEGGGGVQCGGGPWPGGGH